MISRSNLFTFCNVGFAKMYTDIKNVIIENAVEIIPEETVIEPIINLDLTT